MSNFLRGALAHARLWRGRSGYPLGHLINRIINKVTVNLLCTIYKIASTPEAGRRYARKGKKQKARFI